MPDDATSQAVTNLESVKIERQGNVAVAEFSRPPENFFDIKLIGELLAAFQALDADRDCRAIVLASTGKVFCAGANFSRPSEARLGDGGPSALYALAAKLFGCTTPVVAAIQGAAIGGGLGLSLVADFRVVSPAARFAANFVKIGIHPGFGLTFTLPRLVGLQNASLLMQTGRRVGGEEALSLGLADVLAEPEALRTRAVELAQEIAENAPLAVAATRATLRQGLAAAVAEQTRHELAEQSKLFQTADYREGVVAVRERRSGRFVGA